MLRGTSAQVECAVSGASMGRAIPDGATVRIRLDSAADAPHHAAVALLLSGETFTIHRLVRRGRSARARGFVITHGDGNVFCDAPQRENDVLGTVIAVRTDASGRWHAIPPPTDSGLRRALTLAFEHLMGGALELSPRCGIALKNALVLILTPFVWLRAQRPGRRRNASRLITTSRVTPA